MLKSGMFSDVDRLRREMTANERHRAHLMRELERSLALRDFYPEAFEHGTCKTRVTGNPFRPWDALFICKRGDHDTREWPAREVPLILWQGAFDQMRREGNRDTRARRFYNELEKGNGNG